MTRARLPAAVIDWTSAATLDLIRDPADEDPTLPSADRDEVEPVASAVRRPAVVHVDTCPVGAEYVQIVRRALTPAGELFSWRDVAACFAGIPRRPRQTFHDPAYRLPGGGMVKRDHLRAWLRRMENPQRYPSLHEPARVMRTWLDTLGRLVDMGDEYPEVQR